MGDYDSLRGTEERRDRHRRVSSKGVTDHDKTRRTRVLYYIGAHRDRQCSGSCITKPCWDPSHSRSSLSFYLQQRNGGRGSTILNLIAITPPAFVVGVLPTCNIGVLVVEALVNASPQHMLRCQQRLPAFDAIKGPRESFRSGQR